MSHLERRLGVSASGMERRRAMSPIDVRCWYFGEGSDSLGCPLRFLTLVVETARECLVLEVERLMSSERIRDTPPSLQHLLHWLAHEAFTVR